MALTVKSIVLNDGVQLIQESSSGWARFAAHSFDLGSGSNYTPLASDNAVNGTLVYTGTAHQIDAKAVDDHTMSYTLTIPEGAGPFSFGSIILYANHIDGTRLPMLEASLPFAIQKIFADPNLGIESPFPLPGSRLVITFTVVTDINSSSASIEVVVTAPSFASLPYFPDELTLPPPNVQPWNQFILSQHSLTGAPALVVKGPDNTYWGTGLLQNLTSPLFGTINGGFSGDNYETDPCNYAWGGTYVMTDADYAGNLGGYGYTTINTGQITNDIIGNRAYTDR